MTNAVIRASIAGLAFSVGVASAPFFLPIWIIPFRQAMQASNPADWIGFAGSLVSGAMTIVAAGIAWSAVQNELSEKATREQKQQAEAKLAAVLVITQTVHVAATIVHLINRVFQLDDARQKGSLLEFDTDAKIRIVRDMIDECVEHLEATFSHSAIPQAWQGLAIDDKSTYLMLTSTIHTTLLLFKSPAMSDWRASLPLRRDNLLKFGAILRAFDADLADVFERDANR